MRGCVVKVFVIVTGSGGSGSADVSVRKCVCEGVRCL